MSEIENLAPAAAGDDTNAAPAAAEREQTLPQNLSLEQAAAGWSEAEAETASKTQESAEPNEHGERQEPDPSAAGEGETEAASATEGDSEPPAAGEPDNQSEDPEPIDFDKLHGNTKLRLRDRSEITIAEVKKRWGDLQGLEQERQAFQAHVRQESQRLQETAQQAQLLSQVLPRAMAAIQAQLPEVPPMPPAELLGQNFLEYTRQKDAHDRGRAAREAKEQELYQLQQVHHQTQQQETAKQRQAIEGYLAQENARLVEKMPELKTPEKARAFQQDFLNAGRTYGFTDEEMSQTRDHRLLMMVRDLTQTRRELDELRGLRANPPKPTKTQQAQAAKPGAVAQPGARVATGEAEATKRQELMARARNGGRGSSLEEITRLYVQANS
jgi:hypothetical protein